MGLRLAALGAAGAPLQAMTSAKQQPIRQPQNTFSFFIIFLHLRIKYSVSLESLNTVELPVSNHPKCQTLEVPYERWSSTRA